jgi:hypothetical protein
VYTLDTNAMIYYIRDDAEAAPFMQSLLDDPTIPVYVSTITEAELFSHSDSEAASSLTLSSDDTPIIDLLLLSVRLR